MKLDKFLCLDDQHPSENSVNITTNSLVHKYELNMRNYLLYMLTRLRHFQHGTCTQELCYSLEPGKFKLRDLIGQYAGSICRRSRKLFHRSR